MSIFKRLAMESVFFENVNVLNTDVLTQTINEFSNITECNIAFSSDKRVVWADSKFYTTSGFSPSDLHSKSFNYFFRLIPDQSYNSIQNILELDNLEIGMLFFYRRRQSSPGVGVICNSINGGEFPHRISFVDISAIFYKFTDLYKQLQNQTSKISVINDFISILLHDLRNSVGAGLRLSEIVHNEYNTGRVDDLDKQFSVIISAAHSSLEILNKLQDWYYSIKDGTSVLREVDLTKLTKEILNELSIFAELKGISIKNKISKRIYTSVNAEVFRIVLRNFITNSIKFSKQNSEIKLYFTLSENIILVHVEDTGIGISSIIANKILNGEPVFPEIGTFNERGCGKGLSICNDILKRNNGQMFIAGTPGVGSLFSFSLPISR